MAGLLLAWSSLSLPLDSAAQGISAPVLKWTRGGCRDTWCRTGWYASPAVADLDGDGKPEVIWSDYRIVVVGGEDGANRWIVNNPGGGRAWPDPVVADVDEDGQLEIVAAHANGYVSVLRANGTPQTGWPRQATSNELRSLAVGDVDGNGDLEIAVASTVSDNQWYVLETYILVANTSPAPADVKVTLLFEDGARAEQTYAGIRANSRFNVPVAAFFPQAAGKRFGAIVESLGTTPAQIVVERAMYWDAGGQRWAAGTNALATRLQ
jgi:hypothetical protein